MVKKSLTILLSLFITLNVFNQTSDDQYKRPLKDVLDEIEVRYKVKATVLGAI